MLEAQPLNGVSELDVDGEVVGVQLEPVVGRQSGILLDVHAERRDSPVERQLPVPVGLGRCLERDRRRDRFRRSVHDRQPIPPSPRVSRQYTAHIRRNCAIYCTLPWEGV